MLHYPNFFSEGGCTGPSSGSSHVQRLMAISPNFTHNISDLLAITNATTPVAVLPDTHTHTHTHTKKTFRDLQIGMIISLPSNTRHSDGFVAND